MRGFHVLPSVLLILVTGCGESFETTEMVPIEKVPEPVMKVAKEKLPRVTFDTAWTEKEGDKTVYEVRGKLPDGKVLEVD